MPEDTGKMSVMVHYSRAVLMLGRIVEDWDWGLIDVSGCSIAVSFHELHNQMDRKLTEIASDWPMLSTHTGLPLAQRTEALVSFR